MSIVLDGATGEVFPNWTTPTRPASPISGQTGYNTTFNSLDVYNGTSWAAIAASSSNTSYTATQSFVGSTSALAAVFNNSAEVCTVSATAATGTINYDVTTQSVLYYTTNASGNWSINFRGSSGSTLNSVMSTGQSLTLAFLATQGALAYINSSTLIDGVSITPKWQGGTAPTVGNSNSIDVYVFTIIKTASSTYTVLASQTKFA